MKLFFTYEIIFCIRLVINTTTGMLFKVSLELCGLFLGSSYL